MKNKNGYVGIVIVILAALLLAGGSTYLVSQKYPLSFGGHADRQPAAGESGASAVETVTAGADSKNSARIAPGDGLPVIRITSSSFAYSAPTAEYPHGSLMAEGILNIVASSSRVTLHRWDNRGDFNDAFATIQFKNTKSTFEDEKIFVGNTYRTQQNEKDGVYTFADGRELPDIISLNVGDAVNIKVRATLDLSTHKLAAGSYISGIASINCDGSLCGFWDKAGNPIHRLGGTLALTDKQLSSVYGGPGITGAAGTVGVSAGANSASQAAIFPDSSADSEIIRAPAGYAEAHTVVDVVTPPVQTPSSAAGMTKFASGNFAYTFEYPSSLNLAIEPYNKYVRRESESSGYRDADNYNLVQYNFDVGSSTDLGLCDSLERLSQVGIQNGDTYNHVTINGKTFLKSTEHSNSNDIGFSVTYTTTHKDVCYRFTERAVRQTPSDMTANQYEMERKAAKPSDFYSNLSVIDKIIKTLQF